MMAKDMTDNKNRLWMGIIAIVAGVAVILIGDGYVWHITDGMELSLQSVGVVFLAMGALSIRKYIVDKKKARKVVRN